MERHLVKGDEHPKLKGDEHPKRVELSSVLGVVSSLIGVLATKAFVGSTHPAQNGHFAFWVSLVLSAAAAVVLMVFTFFLKREPSKVFQLREKLISAYVDGLVDSMLVDSVKDGRVAGKA